MKGLIGSDENLKQDSLSDGQPVELFKDRGDMVVLAASGCEACRSILDTLNLSQFSVRKPRQDYIAVVEAGRDEGVDQGLSGLESEELPDSANSAQLEKGSSAEHRDVG